MASEDLNSKLLMEVFNANIRGIQKALKDGADINYVNEFGSFALLLASDDDSYYKVAKFLIKKGADVNLTNSDGTSALMKACEYRYGTEAIIELLFKRGVHVNAVNSNGESVLITACYVAPSESIITTLLKHRAEINLQDNAG